MNKSEKEEINRGWREWEKREELEGLREFLANDEVYNYQGYVGKAKVNLLYLIQGKEGECKHWFRKRKLVS
jgi:hypothetical protein